MHLSELAHQKVADPADILKVGQKVDVQVINIEPDERRIGLSIKALLPVTKEMLEQIQREREEEEARKSADAAERKEQKSSKKLVEAIKVVASKTGKKYYAADSTQAEKIKEENRIEFESAADAEEAGYSA